MTLFQPTYFSPIIQYVNIVKSTEVVFEVEDNFQKQTYRNRCYIYTANGKHLLNVPIQHNKGLKQKMKDVKIDYKDDWHKLHLKTLKTAYSSSPYFEFYIDDILPVFEKRFTYLLDLNIMTYTFVTDALQLEIPYEKTLAYIETPLYSDRRNLAIAKSIEDFNLKKYKQVFDENHGFISNLSILDLIFMEGPNSLNYLESQPLIF